MFNLLKPYILHSTILLYMNTYVDILIIKMKASMYTC